MGGDKGRFYERLLSPALSSIYKNGGEGAKGSRSWKVFGHRQTGADWFAGGKSKLILGWGLRPRTGALRVLGNMPQDVPASIRRDT